MSHDFNLTRNQLISQAYRKIGITRSGQSPSAAQLQEAVDALNLIIRQEDAKGTDQAKNLWAIAERTLQLDANGFTYTTADGLADDILDLTYAIYRDSTGDDVPLIIKDAQGYETTGDKNETGTPEFIYLKKHKDLASQILYVWPALSSVATSHMVTGTDGMNYRCQMGHTAATINRPITGSSWRIYWDLDSTAAPASEATGWVFEALIGTRNSINVTFTISNTPDLNSLIVIHNNALVTRVASSPASGEYSISGTTITMGLAPDATDTLRAQYWISGYDWATANAASTEGSTWVSGTAYTSGELIRYAYKRPLADFDNATDNPDMPQGWTRYLLHKLAVDLAANNGIAMDERLWLQGQAKDAREDIFPSTTSGANDYHDKAEYF